MPMGAVETDGETERRGSRALARDDSRPGPPESGQPDRLSEFDTRIQALQQSLVRTDPLDLDALVAATLAALGEGLGAERVDFYASNRLDSSAAFVGEETFPLRGGWTRRRRRFGPDAPPSASLDLAGLGEVGLGLRAGQRQRIEATRPLAPAGSARELASNLWRPLRSRVALPCRAGSELLGVLVVESALSAARESERLLARAESALACFAMGLDRFRLAREVDGLRARQGQQERFETLGRVAGGVAHDVNNVLTAIVGYSDLLELELAEGGTGEIELAEIRAAADRAGELVEQVLSFGRPRASLVESIDLCERVRGLEGMIGRVLGDGIELEIDTDHEPHADLARSASRTHAPAFVRIDPTRLERALLNLASNARAALEGSRAPARFRISTRRVLIDRDARDAKAPRSARIPGLREGWHLRLTARDNGCGMDPALAQRIFEPFFTTREQSGGTGLGLAMIDELVRESRGGIRVESAPGEGTAFHLYFPIAAPDSAAEPRVTPRLDSRSTHV